jgi:hypothetical protein
MLVSRLSYGCSRLLGLALAGTAINGCLLGGEKATAVVSASPSKPLIVHTGIQFRELRLSDDSPDKFRANFIIWYSWQLQPGQNWSSDKIRFANEIGSPAIKVPIWTKLDQQFPQQRFEAVIYEGEFKTFNRYQAFPFDAHLLSIRMICPQVNCGNVTFVSSPERVTLDRRAAQVFAGWNIAGMGFASHPIKLPEDLNLGTADRGLRLPSSVSTFHEFAIAVRRDVLPGIILLFIPILLIWLLAYIGLYWEDSSPASRFGATALFVAIAFNLAARSLQPAVPYVTLMSLTFLALYVNILLIVIMTTLSFYFRPRKVNHERISHLGRWLAPMVFFLTLILLIPAAQLGQNIYFERHLEQMQFKSWPNS